MRIEELICEPWFWVFACVYIVGLRAYEIYLEEKNKP